MSDKITYLDGYGWGADGVAFLAPGLPPITWWERILSFILRLVLMPFLGPGLIFRW